MNNKHPANDIRTVFLHKAGDSPKNDLSSAETLMQTARPDPCGSFEKEVSDMWLKLISSFSIAVFFPAVVYSGEQNERKTLPKVTNEVYMANCGSCHFAYQPGLLPAKSWQKIIDTPGGHSGGDLSLEVNAKTEIVKYLTQNSAERADSKRSRKILASIGNTVPTKISEVPYIREKHHEIDQTVFSRKTIGSRGNCIACHRTAESGDYDDNNVTIPN